MYSSEELGKFEQLIQECLGKKYPTREDDMSIFYLGICSLKKAIDQADANIKLDLTDEEAKNATYRKHFDYKMGKIEALFKHYVCDVKGFENESYFEEWKHGVDKIANTNSNWMENVKLCTNRLHSFVFST